MPDISAPDSPGSNGDLVDLAIPYALDAVSPAEGNDIEQRLRTSEPDTVRVFDNTVREVREVMAALSVLDAQAPPARLEARILAALGFRPGARSDVDTTDPGRDPSTGAPPPPRPGSAAAPDDGLRPPGGAHSDELARARERKALRWRRFAAAAAAVVVAIGIAVGVNVIGQRTGEEPSGVVTAEDVRGRGDVRNSVTEIGSGGTLVVDYSAELGAAAVSIESVPAPPAGRDYQLWVVDAAGAPRSVGVLLDPPAQTAPYVTDVTGTDQLAVTVEPDGGSPAPTSDPIGAIALAE